MKKFFFLFALTLGAMASMAQAPYGTSGVFPLTVGDTLNNVDSVFKVLPVTAGYNTIGITVNLTNISGTDAGKAILYGSQDGITWFPTDSLTYVVPLTSSHGKPTATHTAYFSKTGAPWTSYMIVATSSGTVSAQVRVRYVLRYTNTARSM